MNEWQHNGIKLHSAHGKSFNAIKIHHRILGEWKKVLKSTDEENQRHFATFIYSIISITIGKLSG